MLPSRKDNPRHQEHGSPIWHVPETAPSWHVPEPRARSWHVPEPPSESLDVPVSSQLREKERGHPDADRRSQRPADLSTPNSPSTSFGVKTKASMKEIPTIQLGESSTSSAAVPRKRPIPTIPGDLLKNHPSVPRKRPIPTIPPGGTLLEASPFNRPAGPSCLKRVSMGEPSHSNPKKAGVRFQIPLETPSSSSMKYGSGSTTTFEGPSRLVPQLLKVGKSQSAAPDPRPILTGESMGECSTSMTPKRRKSKKSGGGPKPPTSKKPKVTEWKSTSQVASSQLADDASSKQGKFILTIPPEFHFKGDPPPWIRALYLEPLLGGWKREIVERATATKKTSDVYYYSPEGRKFRSRVEIGQYLLDEGITKYSAAFNFWFKGTVLGEEFQPYEVIRSSGNQSVNQGPPPLIAIRRPPIKTSMPREQLSLPDPEVEDYSEEGMIFDEEIEVVGTGDGQDAVFDPAVLSLRNQPVQMRNIPEVRERHEVPGRMAPPKKRKQPSTSNAEGNSSTSTDNKLFCICDDVEHGDMVLCDNIACEIGWYHFGCVNITSSPAGSWYCPICRGASSEVMNIVELEK